MNNVEKNIFKAFFDSKTNKLYFNQLKDLTKASNSSLQNSLKKFEKDRIIRKEKTISNAFYVLNDKKIFEFEFSKLAYKKFKELNMGVRVPLKNFLKEVPFSIFTIVLFGSSSIKEENNESDIDILVVSYDNINLDELKNKINIVSNYPISIFYSTIHDFNYNTDNIIIQAKKTGFPIYKEQNFYEVILNEYR